MRWKRRCTTWRRHFAARPLQRFVTLVLIVPFLVATASYTAFFAGSELELFASIADDAAGRHMALWANSTAPRRNARTIALLDFDDRTFADLGDPVLVPPPEIAKAFKRLAGAKPWAVVVDIDLSYVQEPQDVAALREGLISLARSGALILLVRPPIVPSTDGGRRRFRPSPLDPLVSDLRGTLWATGSVPVAQDGVVREFKPLATGELNARAVTLPSAPLAIRILAAQGDAGSTEEVLDAGIAGRSRCLSRSAPEAVFCTRRGPIVVERDGRAKIEYTFTWEDLPAPSEQYPIIGPSGARAQILRMPTGPLLKKPDEVHTGAFEQSVVFISASAGGRDEAQTPLGPMPGAFALANAVRAWLEFGIPRRSTYLRGLIVVLALSLILTFVALAAMHWSKGRYRFMEAQLATLLTAILWMLFYFSRGGSLSVGILVSSYVMILSIQTGYRVLYGQRPSP